MPDPTSKITIAPISPNGTGHDDLLSRQLATQIQSMGWDPPLPPESLSEADKERFTDLGNARRFTRLHGHAFRHTAQWGWLAWTGQRWDKDSSGLVMRGVKRTLADFYLEVAELLGQAKQFAALAGMDGVTDEQRTEYSKKADDLTSIAQAMGKWAKQCQGRARIEATVKLAESELPIAAKMEDFNKNHWLLNTQDGTIDLHTGQLRPHNQVDMLTALSPSHYDPTALCPIWDKFLHRIMDGNAEMIEFLQRIIGYSLTGDVSEQVLFFLYGGGSNGKSTFVNTLLSILGHDYAIQSAPDLLVEKSGERHPTEIADIYGKRLVASIEVEEGKRMAEGLVKTMTGGDKLKGRLMRQDFFQFDATHKLFFVANHKPVVKGTDFAIWRRIKLIPFMVTISDEEKDPTLPAKLLTEGPGILAWAVRGCLEWQRRGLTIPASVQTATEAYRVESDTLATFLAECVIDVLAGEVQAKLLYAEYQSWCEDNGERFMNGTQFGRRLSERGYDKYKNPGSGRTFYLGIGLLNRD